MPKQHANFRLSTEALKQLKVMTETLGRSQSAVIEFALEFYYRDRWPEQLSFMLREGVVKWADEPGKLAHSDAVAQKVIQASPPAPAPTPKPAKKVRRGRRR